MREISQLKTVMGQKKIGEIIHWLYQLRICESIPNYEPYIYNYIAILQV